MAKKQRTPEQEAIRAAFNKPARQWFISRRMFWFNYGDWSYFTNWRGFSLSVGNIPGATDKDSAPKAVLLVSLDWRPFGFSIWWRSRHLVWIGDWEWKKTLKEG